MLTIISIFFSVKILFILTNGTTCIFMFYHFCDTYFISCRIHKVNRKKICGPKFWGLKEKILTKFLEWKFMILNYFWKIWQKLKVRLDIWKSVIGFFLQNINNNITIRFHLFNGNLKITFTMIYVNLK